jgi:hypothetical protein
VLVLVLVLVLGIVLVAFSPVGARKGASRLRGNVSI